MINLNDFETLENLKQYYDYLDETSYNLYFNLAPYKQKFLEQYKKARKAKSKGLKEKRKDDLLNKLIAYSNYFLNECETANKDWPILAFIEKQLDEINEIFKSLPEFHIKTNEEWLTVLTDLMNQRSKRKYSAKFFDREFRYMGVGTKSDNPRWYETQIDTTVAIVADDFNIDNVPNRTFSWPQEHPEDYENSDFILYEKLRCKLEPQEYLPEEKRVINLWGMPEDVKTAIAELIFQEYKQKITQRKPAVKQLS
ncbi:MAG: hypothetical protein PHI22_01415 [Bacilli bacterium]|nr:hypothetical protein [Bacilli bacterium]